MTDTPAAGTVMIDAVDRQIIQLTSSGLPLVSRPYEALAQDIGITAAEVQERMTRMLENGVIRRIGAIPNHYALGVTANGMSVWQVPAEKIRELGEKVGALDFVSHSYERPQHLPVWPYNLFAMVHGNNREKVEEKVTIIKELLGEDCIAHEILYSSRLLKKTGLRLKN